MNFRVIIFSGIMTALIGAMMGLAVAKIAQREERKPILIIGGATLGFVIGTFQSSVLQRQKLRDEEYEDNS